MHAKYLLDLSHWAEQSSINSTFSTVNLDCLLFMFKLNRAKALTNDCCFGFLVMCASLHGMCVFERLHIIVAERHRDATRLLQGVSTFLKQNSYCVHSILRVSTLGLGVAGWEWEEGRGRGGRR